MATTDWYLKTVLTIIALCLTWLCLASSPIARTVEAQSGHQQRVIVSGWADEAGYIHLFPNQKIGGNSSAPLPLPVRDER